jgi:hypothetical protein
VGDPNGAVGGVDALSSRPRRAEHINLQILWLDLDVDFFGFRKHRHRGSRRVNSPLCLGCRHALHPVNPGLAPKQPVSFVAPDRHDRLLEATEQPIAQRNGLPAEAMTFAVALIHSVQVSRKQRRFIPAGARSNLHDGITVVMGISRKQKLVKLGRESGDFCRKAGQVGLGEGRQLGIGLRRQLAGLLEIPLQAGETVRDFDNGGKTSVFPAERPELAGISCGGGIRQGLADFIRPQQCLAEPGLHALGLGRCGRRLVLILPAEPVNPTGGIDQALLAGEEGMALGAHLHVNRRGGGAGLELVTAGALNHELAVVGMNVGLHRCS